MWQRFTERARKVVYYAQEEAHDFGAGYVCTEHILLGLLRESDSTALTILSHLGKSPAVIRSAIKKQVPKGEVRRSLDMALTPRAKRVIDLAYDEARRLNHNYIGTEHLLLALVREGDGLAGRILAREGVELKDARAMISQLKPENPNHPQAEPSTPPPPRSRIADLKVRFDLNLLSPVDQLLVSLLSDVQSPLGERLRRACPSLDWLLPSILSTMAKDTEERWTLEQTITVANRLARDASREEVTLEDLFVASLAGTGGEVRAVLGGLDLAPDEE